MTNNVRQGSVLIFADIGALSELHLRTDMISVFNIFQIFFFRPALYTTELEINFTTFLSRFNAKAFVIRMHQQVNAIDWFNTIMILLFK